MVNLYNVRWKKRYSRKEIVDALGISPTTATKLLKNERHNFRFSTVEKIAKFLDCKALDLLEEVSD